jgi:two-component system sensor histidine kinase KdpD
VDGARHFFEVMLRVTAQRFLARCHNKTRPMRLRSHTRDVLLFSGSVVATAVAVAVLKMVPDVSTTTEALALLVVVLIVATLGRLWVAIATALIATLTLNFLFLPPIGTFTIADPQNWVALAAFLIAAVMASNLSAAARARADDAIARRNEVNRLFDLTRDVLLTTETAAAIETLARHVARRFELTRVAICLPVADGWQTHQGGSDTIHLGPEVLNNALAKARGALDFDAHRRTYGGHVSVEDSGRHVTIVPLRHGTRAVGLLAAGVDAIDIGALDAVAGVVAIAIERTQFLEDREAAERLRQKAELAATLLAALSHDLKTPLTAIRLAVENLQDALPPEVRRSQAVAAVAELERLDRLFQDILDMARIDAAAVHVERQWVTPADVVDAAAAHVRHALDGRDVRIAADNESAIEIDPRVASVALSHLLENAAHYSPRDREIAVDAQADSEGLQIAVTDHGPGLDPGDLDHLFERFYRGRAARRLAPGSGLGLAITRGLLNAVGGRVWAENLPQGGARFTIVVPGRHPG